MFSSIRSRLVYFNRVFRKERKKKRRRKGLEETRYISSFLVQIRYSDTLVGYEVNATFQSRIIVTHAS